MSLRPWSLDRLLAWWGGVMVFVLVIPSGVLSTLWISRSVERHLAEKGRFFGQAVAAGLVESILVDDRIRAHEILAEAVGSEAGVRYACVADGRGRVLAHSFVGGYPPALAGLWQGQGERPLRYRSAAERLLDVVVPLPAPRAVRLHIGILRDEALRASQHVMMALALVATAALCLILLGARGVAVLVSRPLQRLEQAVSQYPQRAELAEGGDLGGTREIACLAEGFGHMVARVEALEQERHRTQDALINAERLSAVGELAAGLAHEIRNPLDGMMECVRLLDGDSGKSDKARRYYPMLRDGLERISRTMQSMLVLARSGQQTDVRPCRAGDIIEELRLLVEPQVRDGKVALSWAASGACICVCDRHGLLQAVLNLVLNAVEAAGREDGGGHVHVASTCDARWVMLSVDDNGPGVRPEERHRIFEPFVSTKPVGKGTGLGLSVSRQLIRAVGGELSLDPAPSSLGGARFEIRLPKNLEGCACDDTE